LNKKTIEGKKYITARFSATNFKGSIVLLFIISGTTFEFVESIGVSEISHEPYPETSLHWNIAVQGSEPAPNLFRGQVFVTLPLSLFSVTLDVAKGLTFAFFLGVVRRGSFNPFE
jgi:hypothetical protein